MPKPKAKKIAVPTGQQFYDRLVAGESFYVSLSGKGKGMDVGYVETLQELHSHIAAFASRFRLTNVRVYFSRNIMADPDAVLSFAVEQKISFTKERTY